MRSRMFFSGMLVAFAILTSLCGCLSLSLGGGAEFRSRLDALEHRVESLERRSFGAATPAPTPNFPAP